MRRQRKAKVTKGDWPDTTLLQAFRDGLAKYEERRSRVTDASKRRGG